MNVKECLRNFKLISMIQVDLNYFNNIAPMVFKDPTIYKSLQSDAQFVNQIGGTIFNYFNQSDPASHSIWIEALKAGLVTAINDVNIVKNLTPKDTQYANDLIVVLDEMLADYQAIQNIFS
jgi:hypothetical protein